MGAPFAEMGCYQYDLMVVSLLCSKGSKSTSFASWRSTTKAVSLGM